MDDSRDRWLFLAGAAMSWISPPEALRRELRALHQLVGELETPDTSETP